MQKGHIYKQGSKRSGKGRTHPFYTNLLSWNYSRPILVSSEVLPCDLTTLHWSPPLKGFTTSTLSPCGPSFQHMTLGGTNHIQSTADGFCKKCLFQSDQDIVSLELSRSARDTGQRHKDSKGRKQANRTVFNRTKVAKYQEKHLRMWTDLDSSSNSSTSWLCGPEQVT